MILDGSYSSFVVCILPQFKVMIFKVCSALKARALLIAPSNSLGGCYYMQGIQIVGLEVIHYYFNANLNRILNTKSLPNSERYLSKINVPVTHQS